MQRIANQNVRSPEAGMLADGGTAQVSELGPVQILPYPYRPWVGVEGPVKLAAVLDADASEAGYHSSGSGPFPHLVQAWKSHLAINDAGMNLHSRFSTSTSNKLSPQGQNQLRRKLPP